MKCGWLTPSRPLTNAPGAKTSTVHRVSIRGAQSVQTIRSHDELEQWLGRVDGATLALVPTMGALHAGHLALVDRARTLSDQVIASIFVNPTQFNVASDLERYPRSEESDLAMLEAGGCSAVWLPRDEQIYPGGFSTSISVGGVSRRWEGEARPGHFDAVATIVAKLLIAVAPDVAVFGQKDFQQLAVIRRMVADLGLPVKIAAVATVRDKDGLALSSRNSLLSATERGQAIALPQALVNARDAIRSGEDVARTAARAKQQLVEAGFFKVDYLALVDSGTLEPLDAPGENMRLIAAATIGSTRLIDNIAV